MISKWNAYYQDKATPIESVTIGPDRCEYYYLEDRATPISETEARRIVSEFVVERMRGWITRIEYIET